MSHQRPSAVSSGAVSDEVHLGTSSVPPSPYINTLKQLEYILIGAVGTWYWQVHSHLLDIFSHTEESGWVVQLATVALFLMAMNLAIFAYLLTLPARGKVPEYSRWSTDPHLRSLIPILTFCIVGGYTLLVLTLSPTFAPMPPSAALSHRLGDAVRSAGGNFKSASSAIQLLVHDAARSLGLNPASTSGSASSKLSSAASNAASDVKLDTASVLRALRLSPEEGGPSLAARLGLPPSSGSRIVEALERYQERAQTWKEGNVTVLGWTGAICGSGSAYLLVFGLVGLLGLTAPKKQGPKKD